MLLQFIINGLITGLLYSLLAIGYALVYKITHIFHIAAAGECALILAEFADVEMLNWDGKKGKIGF